MLGRSEGRLIFSEREESAVEVSVIRSRRRTVTLQITPEGRVVVRCPEGVSDREVKNFVRSKEQWLKSHLAKLPPALPKFTQEELEILTEEARCDLARRVSRYARQMGLTYGRITVRRQKSRWGSCSSQGNLNFNCLLMLTPPEIRDYVVVHELCHRKEMNHSARFWAEVDKILPDYEARRRWLRDQGAALIGRLP